MNKTFEGNVGGYSFIMNEDDVIEVWGQTDLENPESYIFVTPGSIRDQKTFEQEISFWYIKNIG